MMLPKKSETKDSKQETNNQIIISKSLATPFLTQKNSKTNCSLSNKQFFNDLHHTIIIGSISSQRTCSAINYLSANYCCTKDLLTGLKPLAQNQHSLLISPRQ